MNKMDDYPDYDYEFYQFMDLMKEATEKLNQMTMMQEHMRWQFGDPEEYEKFVEAMKRATDGWMSSHC